MEPYPSAHWRVGGTRPRCDCLFERSKPSRLASSSILVTRVPASLSWFGRTIAIVAMISTMALYRALPSHRTLWPDLRRQISCTDMYKHLRLSPQINRSTYHPRIKVEVLLSSITPNTSRKCWHCWTTARRTEKCRQAVTKTPLATSRGLPEHC